VSCIGETVTICFKLNFFSQLNEKQEIVLKSDENLKSDKKIE